MKVLDIARSQIGVKEQPPGSNNVIYNKWYYGGVVSGATYPWCMAFVQWCFAEARTPLPYKTASCSALLNWYKRNQPERVSMTPHVGDIVLYTYGHCGIVETVNGDGTITAIEGNTGTHSENNGGEVMRKTRSQSALINAYITPYNAQGDVDIALNTIKRGVKGEQVKTVQRLLVIFGYDIGKSGVDGDCGAKTEGAIMAYQRDNGLTVDGVCGKNTWSKLLGVSG